MYLDEISRKHQYTTGTYFSDEELAKTHSGFSDVASNRTVSAFIYPFVRRLNITQVGDSHVISVPCSSICSKRRSFFTS